MINIDCKHRPPKQDAHNTLKGVVIGFAIALGLIAILSDVAETKAALVADSVVGATFDNLMSEDMAAYTVLYGHNKIYTEFDME